jgi:hypothetical protein
MYKKFKAEPTKENRKDVALMIQTIMGSIT